MFFNSATLSLASSLERGSDAATAEPEAGVESGAVEGSGMERLGWGVNASPVGGEDSSTEVDVPFEVGFRGVDASAGRNWTRIFFSWMEDLLVCSTCDHYVSHVSLAVYICLGTNWRRERGWRVRELERC